MVNHEFEWPDDATGLESNPVCERCTKPLSVHPDEVSGVYAEDELAPWQGPDFADVLSRYR